IADGSGEDHERGPARSGWPAQVGKHTAVVRELDVALEQAARLHELLSRLMDGRRPVVDGPDKSGLIRPLCHLREKLAQVEARHARLDRPKWPANPRWCVRLGVPGVDVTGATDQEQKDAAFAAGVGRTAAGERRGQRYPGSHRADAQEITSAPALGR